MRPALALLALIAALPASAGTVAYVDYQYLVEKAPQISASENLLRKEFADKREAIAGERAKVKKLHQSVMEFDPGTSSLKRASVIEKLRHARRKLRADASSYRTRLGLRRSELRSSFEKLVQREIAAYAQAHGFSVVLRDGVRYAASGVDISKAILARLKQDYRQAQAQTGKQ